MKILIIGEYSGFAKNLSDGFRTLGHKCFVFSWGDNFKKIIQSESYLVNDYKSSSRIINFFLIFFSLYNNIKLKIQVLKMSKEGRYDIILIINSDFIKCGLKFWRPYFTKRMVLSLIKDPRQIYLSACGVDICFYEYWINKKAKSCFLAQKCEERYRSHYQVRLHHHVSSFVDKVIPVMYEYAQAWRNSKYAEGWQVLPTLPLPVKVDSYKTINVVKDKIIIFHGINRPEIKGTSFILEAMNRLANNYPDKVDCISLGGIPLADYLEELKKCNICVDQTYGCYTGMNGLFSMAMGKVLLAGNIADNKKEFGCYNIPIIDIGPDSEQIYKELEKLVLNKDVISALSKQSRLYVESVHDSVVVAKRYISLFEGFLYAI